MWFTNSYDRYDFAFGETRNLSSSSLVKVHHSLVRARARANRCVRGIEQTCGSLVVIAFFLQPASSRRGPQRIRLFGPFRLVHGRFASGGAEETRTPDFRLA